MTAQRGRFISKAGMIPIIVPRAVVVVESMTAITLLDLLMMSMTSRLDRMQHYFGIDPE